MKQWMNVEIRGREKTWGFLFKGDPKYLAEWRADGLTVDIVVNRIPEWANNLGLTRIWAEFKTPGMQFAFGEAMTTAKPEALPVAGYVSWTGHGTCYRETITDDLRSLEWAGRPMWSPLVLQSDALSAIQAKDEEIARLTAELAKAREDAERKDAALREALSVCASVRTGNDRRVELIGGTCFAQTEEWCRWAEDEVQPMLRAAIDAALTKEGKHA